MRLRIREVVEEKGKTADVQSEAVGLERVMEARELDVTPGKLNLVQKLGETQEDWDEVKDQAYWLERSVKEINKEIQANRKEMNQTENNNGNNAGGNGGGNGGSGGNNGGSGGSNGGNGGGGS